MVEMSLQDIFIGLTCIISAVSLVATMVLLFGRGRVTDLIQEACKIFGVSSATDLLVLLRKFKSDEQIDTTQDAAIAENRAAVASLEAELEALKKRV